jgi:hypothetical protein
VEAHRQVQHFFLITNFATVSTLATAIAATLSIVFLFAYLSVFDGFLIMTIEYSDVLKLIIVGIFVASFVLFSFRAFLDILLNFMSIVKPSKTSVLLLVLLILILAFFPVIISYFYDRTALVFDIARMASILIGAFAVFIASGMYSSKKFDLVGILNTTMILFIFVFAVGYTFGLFLRDLGRAHSISIRDNDTTIGTIENTKLIMFTSHHVIFLYANTVMLVPTANIIELRYAE